MKLYYNTVMRLHRFLIEPQITDISTTSHVVIKDSDLIHQLLHVFRYEAGTELIIFNGNGIDYSAVIESIDKKSVTINIVSQKASQYIGKSYISLFQSITKSSTFDTIVEKATELGVGNIIPIISERSERKDINSERLNKIIKEAIEQSGRGDTVTLQQPVKLFSFNKDPQDVFVFDMTGQPITSMGNLLEITNKKDQSKEISILIGPEGGWSPAEISWFTEKKFKIISFNTPVLRAETAAVSALALLLCTQ